MAASKNQKGKRGTTGKTAKSTASRRKTTAKKQKCYKWIPDRNHSADHSGCFYDPGYQ